MRGHSKEGGEGGDRQEGGHSAVTVPPLLLLDLDLMELSPSFTEKCEEWRSPWAHLLEELYPQECWSPPSPWTLPQGPTSNHA